VNARNIIIVVLAVLVAFLVWLVQEMAQDQKREVASWTNAMRCGNESEERMNQWRGTVLLGTPQYFAMMEEEMRLRNVCFGQAVRP
jgi:hypothetical protein